MIPQLAKALSSGFTTKQVLDFLIKQNPQYADQIKAALAAGYTADQIIKFISKSTGQLPEEGSRGTEFEQTRTKDIQRGENINKGALATGALAATSLAAPMAAAALQRAVPSTLSQAVPALISGSNPLSSQPPGQILNPNSQNNNTTQNPPLMQHGGTSVTQPTTNAQTQIKSLDLGPLKSKYQGFFNKIDDLRNSGNDTEGIAAFFRKFSPSQSDKLEKEVGGHLEEIIDKYITDNPISAVQEKKSPEMEKTPQETPTIFKKDIVAAPQGVGEIKEIRNGQAIIDVDGKLHKVKEDELIQSPIPQKDLAQLYEDLLRGIEEETGEEVSRNVNVAAYDPVSNSLAYIPHDGALYIYDDISDEHKAILENVLKTRKTSGQNHIGAWTEGTKSPIGAQMYELIKTLQSERGGKGKEYARKYEMIYRALSAAEKQHKENKRKKKKQP